jgi:ribosomal protein RSM22 (predicted rRNA methylase)
MNPPTFGFSTSNALCVYRIVTQNQNRWSLIYSRLAQHRSLRSSRKLRPVNNKELDDDDSYDDIVPHPLAATEKREPWKTLLEMPARAAWRVTSSVPPSNLQAALTAVLNEGGRNRKQLQRTHEAVLEQHKALAMRRDRERQRLVLGLDYKPIDQQRDEGIHSVMYGPDEVLSSFYFRLFPHYVVIQRVLKEARSLLGHSFSPLRVLDFGVGVGSSSAAAINTFATSVQWVHGIDPSQTMRDGAKFFLDEFLLQTQKASTSVASQTISIPRTTFSAHVSAEEAPGTFCLALLCYTASELPHNAATLAAAAVCWEKLRPGGLFVMVEPGTPDGFSSVRSVRNMLLDCFSEFDESSQETCHVIAPCTHNGPCPMERYQNKATSKYRKTQHVYDEVVEAPDDTAESEEDNDEDNEDGKRKGYCSFVQSMPGGTGSGKGEKFCYLVAHKRDPNMKSHTEPRFATDNLPDLLHRTLASTIASGDRGQPHDTALLNDALDLEARFLDSNDDSLGLELVCGDENRHTYGRIIRAPKKKKGHVLIDCCVAPGKVVRSRVSKSTSYDAPGVYAASRKSRWGGLWPHVPDMTVE